MLQSRRERCTRRSIPQLNHILASCGQHPFPIPAEETFTVFPEPFMIQSREDFLARGGVPEPCRAIRAGAQDSVSIRAEARPGHAVRVLENRPAELRGRHFPDPRQLLATARGEMASVWVKSHVMDSTIIREQSDESSRGHLKDLNH